MTLRVGIVGAGRMGRLHAGVVAAHAGSRVVAVQDDDPAYGSALAAEHGAASIASVEALVQSPEVDAVIVASRSASHGEHLALAVQAGKPVLCEKPLDLDPASVARCARVLREFPHRVQVAFNRRFDAGFLELRRAVPGVGRVEQVQITTRVPQPPPYRYVDDSGGLFFDMTTAG